MTLLLNACWIRGDLDLTERALELMRLGAGNVGDYVIVADMHARAKNWAAAAAFQTEAVDQGLAQSPGFSAVEVRGELHRFVSQDMSHPRSRDIYEMLHQMEWQRRFNGYKPVWQLSCEFVVRLQLVKDFFFATAKIAKEREKKLHAYIRRHRCGFSGSSHASEGKMDIFSVWSHMLELQTVENKQN